MFNSSDDITMTSQWWTKYCIKITTSGKTMWKYYNWKTLFWFGQWFLTTNIDPKKSLHLIWNYNKAFNRKNSQSPFIRQFWIIQQYLPLIFILLTIFTIYNSAGSIDYYRETFSSKIHYSPKRQIFFLA